MEKWAGLGTIDLLGRLNQKFRAFDAEPGTVLWEQNWGGTIQNSTITYAVNGKQYVAVLTGEGITTGGPINQAGTRPHARLRRAVRVRATVSGSPG
jgi:outer membrane protein assembly factor BamB